MVWRAFFFAVGTMLIIVGVECLLIDSATMAAKRKRQQIKPAAAASWFQEPQPEVQVVVTNKVVKPPDWVRWSLIASGSVIVLYALTLRQRNG